MNIYPITSAGKQNWATVQVIYLAGLSETPVFDHSFGFVVASSFPHFASNVPGPRSTTVGLKVSIVLPIPS